MSTLPEMLRRYDELEGDDARASFRKKVRAFVVQNGYQPLTQLSINNGVPDSVLDELQRRFEGGKSKWWQWNLGNQNDDAYLAAVQQEISRREAAPEPARSVKVRRAKYRGDRENLTEDLSLASLELKRRDLMNIRRYDPDGYTDGDGDYLRQLKRLVTLQKYRKTMKQKQQPYKQVEHFKAPTAQQAKEQADELAVAEAAPELRRSGRVRAKPTHFEAGQGAGLDSKKKPTAGVEDEGIDPDVGRVRQAPSGYVPRGREKSVAEAQEQAEADDDDEREPTEPVAEQQRATSSGMSDTQLARVKRLYYGTADTPAMVTSARTMYPLLLQEGDPPSMSQLKAWVSEQALSQAFKPFHAKGGGDVKPFTATTPLRNLGMDLFTATDYGGKQMDKASRKGRFWDAWGKAGYGLIVVDEYSRYVFTEPLNTKSPVEVSKKLKLILDRVGQMNGGKQIGYIRSDDGAEFLGETAELLKARGIRNVRTLGGAPQSNGQAERAVSSIRKTMARQYVVSGQSWRKLLPLTTQVHNKTVNRTTSRSPADAVRDTSKESLKADLQELRSKQTSRRFKRRQSHDRT